MNEILMTGFLEDIPIYTILKTEDAKMNTVDGDQTCQIFDFVKTPKR